MPLNINSVGSSGVGSSTSSNGKMMYENFTDKLTSDVGGIDFSEFNTDKTLVQSDSGSENIQFPKYPSLFFEYKGDIYGYGLYETGDPNLYKASLNWASGSSSGGITYTKTVSAGKSSILTCGTIRDKVFIVGSSEYDSYNKHARLYMYDGASVVDVFGKDMLDLSDTSGNTPSSDYYAYDRATSRQYYICPVAKPDDQLVDEMIIVATYYNGTSSTNSTYVYWYQISVASNVYVKKIVKAGNESSSFPGYHGIFTTSGKYISSTWYSSYGSSSYTYLYTYNYTINENSVTLTITNHEDMDGSLMVQWSNLSYPLNNNYAVAIFNRYTSRKTNEIYLVNAKNDNISYSKISTDVAQLSSSISVWQGTYAFISFRYKDPCILTSYESSPGSSSYYYVVVRGGKISSKYTVSSNNGNYSVSGYFEKGDTIYSDDGLFKYNCNGSDSTFDTDITEFTISNPGIYTIYSRCSKLYPLDIPPLIIKTNEGIIQNLKVTEINQTTIQANTTSNIKINGMKSEYGIHQYTSDTGRFVFEVK